MCIHCCFPLISGRQRRHNFNSNLEYITCLVWLTHNQVIFFFLCIIARHFKHLYHQETNRIDNTASFISKRLTFHCGEHQEEHRFLCMNVSMDSVVIYSVIKQILRSTNKKSEQKFHDVILI